MHDRARHCHSLPFASGQQVWPVFGAIRKAHAFQRLRHTPPPLLRADSLNQQRELHVFTGRENRNQVECLKDKANLLPAQVGHAAGAQRGCVGTLDSDAAAGGLIDAADQVQQGGLAAAAGP